MKLDENSLKRVIKEAFEEALCSENYPGHSDDKSWAQNELELMLMNNDGNFYNTVYNVCKKKALKGIQLEPQKLANARFVVDKVKQYARDLMEFIEDDKSKIPTIEDRRNAALCFAEDVIEEVNYQVQNERNNQENNQ